MPFSQPSISAFYGRMSDGFAAKKRKLDSSAPSDGFTDEEIQRAINPMSQDWIPTREYESSDIGDLIPGLRNVTFSGRIANFNLSLGRSKADRAAAGWHQMIVKDDTGVIAVKLFFSQYPYQLKIGQLVTIWTTFISNATSNAKRSSCLFSIPYIPMSISMFPGRDTSVHIMFHTHSDNDEACKRPLEWRPRQALSNLLTVQQFLREGDELEHSRMLVCVKSVGAAKSVPSKKDKQINLELTEVGLFDHTGEVMLKLWGVQGCSAQDWRPNQTILLIQRPVLRIFGSRGSVSLGSSTIVDVNPSFDDATWLRKYGEHLTKRESMKQEIPEGIWDVEVIRNGIYRTLFLLRDVDDFVRNDPSQVFSGFLNLIIMDMSLALYHRRNMLLCTECCGLPIYANAKEITCRNCKKSLSLHLNPKIMGRMIDETGCLASGKLLWAESAWTDLFQISVPELLALSTADIKALEQRLVYRRVTLIFGWKEEIGKITVLGAEQ